ncbi:MAG: response regulator [Verrucomicrobiota bacterium]
MARVLIVDDDAEFLGMLREALQTAGHDVVEACNGDEALDQFHSNVIDVIITDIVMPQRGGIETIVELRKEYPDLKVIAISGAVVNGQSRMLDWAKRVGASRTFMKPFEVKDLLMAVRALAAKPAQVSIDPI